MFDFASPLRGDPIRVVMPNEPDDPPSARVLLRRLRSGAGFVILGGLFMVASAIAILGLLTPAYTSGIQVLVDPVDLRGVENEVTARQPLADAGTSLAESQSRVIQSDNVLRRVIDGLALDRDDEFAKPDSKIPLVALLKTASAWCRRPRAGFRPISRSTPCGPS